MTYCKRLIFQNPSYRLTRSLPLRTTVVVASTQVVIWLLDCILNLSFPFSSLPTGTLNRAQSLKRSRGNQLCVGEHFQFAFAFPRENSFLVSLKSFSFRFYDYFRTLVIT